METTNYTLTSTLLQEMITVLNALPAGQVRGLLNRLEQTLVEQDIERNKKQDMKE